MCGIEIDKKEKYILIYVILLDNEEVIFLSIKCHLSFKLFSTFIKCRNISVFTWHGTQLRNIKAYSWSVIVGLSIYLNFQHQNVFFFIHKGLLINKRINSVIFKNQKWTRNFSFLFFLLYFRIKRKYHVNGWKILVYNNYNNYKYNNYFDNAIHFKQKPLGWVSNEKINTLSYGFWVVLRIYIH